MRKLKNITAIILILFFTKSWGDNHNAGQTGHKKPDCITHTVTNESSNITNTITRCRGEVISDFPHKQPEPKETHKNSKEQPNAHWELINSFDDLAAQNSMAESTERIKVFTFWLIWIALGSLFVSIAGIGMVAYTINQNRRTIKIISDAEKLKILKELPRVYIEFEIEEVKEVDTDRFEGQFAIKPKIVNYGENAAFQVKYLVYRLDNGVGGVHVAQVSSPQEDWREFYGDLEGCQMGTMPVIGSRTDETDRSPFIGHIPREGYIQMFDDQENVSRQIPDFGAEWSYYDGQGRCWSGRGEYGIRFFGGKKLWQMSASSGVINKIGFFEKFRGMDVLPMRVEVARSREKDENNYTKSISDLD